MKTKLATTVPVTLRSLLKDHPEWADLPIAVKSDENPDGFDLVGSGQRGSVFEIEVTAELQFANVDKTPEKVLAFWPN